MRRTGQKKANDIGKGGQQAFRPSGTKFPTSSPMTGIVMMMMIMMESCSWLRWAGGDIEAFYLGWKVRIWMGVLLRPLPFSALSLSLARLQMDDMKWICGSNECFCCRSSSSWFRPPCFPLGFVVWSSDDEGCCSKAYQTANEYRQAGAHVANSKTDTAAIRLGMSICPCA
jgi:hypothetical protein